MDAATAYAAWAALIVALLALAVAVHDQVTTTFDRAMRDEPFRWFRDGL